MSKPRKDSFLLSAICALCGATLPVFLHGVPGPMTLFILCAACALSAYRYDRLLPMLFGVLAFAWVSSNVMLAKNRILPGELERQSLSVQGRIVNLPARSLFRTRFEFVLEAPVSGWAASKGSRLLLSCYQCETDFRPGERWKLQVKLKRPNGTASPGAFDYEKWLFRKGISASGYLVDDDLDSPFIQLLSPSPRISQHVWRERLRSRLGELDISERSSGFFRALLIGDRDGLTDRDWEVLRSTGIGHLVAISGLHIGLVMLGAQSLSRYLFNLFPLLFLQIPRVWLCRVIGLAAATGYAAMAGFSIPTQRALTMIALYIVAQLLGREISFIRLLFLTTSVLIITDPFVTLDTSFWLSFGAVFVIAWSSGKRKSLSWLHIQPRIWVGMVPLVLLFFGQFSLLAPLVNLVAVPVVSLFLLPSGLIASLMLLLEMQFIPGAILSTAALVADMGWDCLDSLADLSFANSALISLEPVAITLLMLTGFLLMAPFQLWSSMIYLLTVAAILFPALKFLTSGTFPYPSSMWGRACPLSSALATQSRYMTRVRRVLRDLTLESQVVVPYLLTARVRKIDLFVVSHGDNDHIGGSGAVIAAMSPSRILSSVPDQLPDAESCQRGMNWEADGVSFEIISPAPGTSVGSNNRSCVLRIVGAWGTALLPGDIEKEVELELVSEVPEKLSADVLLVPHQGSRTSSRPVFLERVSPAVAVIASGYLNSYGHPHRSVVERYRKLKTTILNTAESGTIYIDVFQAGIKIREFRSDNRRFWMHSTPAESSPRR